MSEMVKNLVVEGKEVTLTGRGPVWLYLYIAHHLQDKIKGLKYYSPVTGEIEIFNYNLF